MNLVFDFGAVLFSWQPKILVRQYFPAVATGDAAALALAQEFFQHSDWLEFDRGALPMAEVISRTSARLKLPLAEVSRLAGDIGKLLEPMPDSVALLRDLHQQREAGRGLRLYFLSNMPAPYARELEQLHPFLQWFDGGIFSSDVNHAKPEPEIFRLLQQRYALEPASTLLIDDMQPNVMAAQVCGWHAIHFESAQQVRAGLQRWITP